MLRLIFSRELIMKSRLMAGMLVAGGLMASGVATAAPWSWTGTLASWAAAGSTGIVDGDGNMAFTFSSASIPDGTTGFITLSELEIAGLDHYDVGVSWDTNAGFPSGYAGSGDLDYRLTVVGGSSNRINSAQLSITQTGTIAPQVVENLYNVPPGAPFASLAVPPSPDGAQFAGRVAVGVNDVFQAQTGGVVQDMHNSFTTAVPEPETYALFLAGLGVIGMLARRRKSV
jgi:hypothetical protein